MDCIWIGWCALAPEAQAAWVQAIGSILAIGVAIVIALAQHQASERVRTRMEYERRELEEARARSIGIGIYPDLVRIGAAAEAATKLPEDAKAYEITRALNLLLDTDLKRVSSSSWELGPAAKPVQGLLFTLDHIQDLIDRLGALTLPKFREQHWDELVKCVSFAREQASAAQVALTAMIVRTQR